MWRATDLVGAPGLEGVRIVAGDADAGGVNVTSVFVVEDPGEVERAPAGSVCLLSRTASAIESYRLDMCLRAAAAQGVAAVALYLLDGHPPSRSSRAIADKSRVSLMTLPGTLNAGAFCAAVQRVIDGSSSQWLARLERLRQTIDEVADDASPEEIASAASEVIGSDVTLAPATEESELASGVVASAGHVLHRVSVEGPWGSLVAALCAAAASRRVEAARRVEEAPIRSQAGLLAELLLGPRTDAASVGVQARQAGLHVDGWHVAMQVDASDGVGGETNPVAGHEVRDEIFRAAVRAAHGGSTAGTWAGTQLRGAVVLVRTWREDPGPRAVAETVREVERILDRLAGRWSALHFSAGVGTAHDGPEGLQASAAEAAAAASVARATSARGRVVAFDAVGLRRMLLAWGASASARSAVNDLLAPLDSLGKPKAETAVRTLAVFLAEQGSYVRAGERLHLHRNAVAYRIRRIAALLDADLSDADDRFALELACRARLTLASSSQHA